MQEIFVQEISCRKFYSLNGADKGSIETIMHATSVSNSTHDSGNPYKLPK